MRSADRRVPLHHAKRSPSSLLSDCLKIDARHHAPTSPMVPPIANVKIGDARSSARGRVRFFDGTPAGEFVLAGICIRPAALGEKYSTFLRRAARYPETMERRARALVHYDGARLPGLSLSNEDRIVRPVHMHPLNAQRLANTKSLPAQRDCNRADVIGVSLDKARSLLR